MMVQNLVQSLVKYLVQSLVKTVKPLVDQLLQGQAPRTRTEQPVRSLSKQLVKQHVEPEATKVATAAAAVVVAAAAAESGCVFINV